jgi:hypothetical protein
VIVATAHQLLVIAFYFRLTKRSSVRSRVIVWVLLECRPAGFTRATCEGENGKVRTVKFFNCNPGSGEQGSLLGRDIRNDPPARLVTKKPVVNRMLAALQRH